MGPAGRQGMQVRSVQGGRARTTSPTFSRSRCRWTRCGEISEVLGKLFMLEDSLNGGGGLTTPCREPASEGSCSETDLNV